MAPYNGLLLIDKPSGVTSHDVVGEVRRILGQKSVGHAGTLDPLATGLMVILLGHATKLSDFVLSQNKRYRVEIQLGVVTDMGDRTGTVISQSDVVVPTEEILSQLEKMVGELVLPVPIYSATKVAGKRLYEYARKDQLIEAPQKSMTFYNLEVVEIQAPKVVCEVSCSKGSYIRSWVEEFGRRLGVGGTVAELRRLESHPYNVHEAVSLPYLKEFRGMGKTLEDLGPGFVPMAETLPGWPQCSVKGREEQLLKNGQISHDLVSRLVVAQKQAHERQGPVGIKVLGSDGDLLGLIEALPLQGLKIRRIFAG